MYYYFTKEKDYDILNDNNIIFYEKITEKSVKYHTNYLNVKNNNCYVVIYELPINTVYWSLGLYKYNKCEQSLNFGNYQTIEKGDVLIVFVCNNNFVMESSKEQITKEYKKKYPYKKLTYHTINYSNDFYFNFESYSNKFLKKPSIKIKEIKFSCKIDFEPLNENLVLSKSLERFCERKDLFEKSKKDYIDDDCSLISINVDTNEDNIPDDCFTNRTNILDISDSYGNNKKPLFKIVAVDHFKSRAALHSNLIFYNADNDEQFSTQITGEISDKIYKNKTISTRRISFVLPYYIKKFYVVEYIYNDFVSGGKINKNTIIPMELYKLRNT